MTKQEYSAFSLPYGVKVLWRDGEIVTLEPRISHFIFDNNEHTKLILRSLPDLIKEIEHKGEKFVPIVKLMQIAYESQDSCITSKNVYVKDNMYTVKVNVFEFAFDIDDNSFISILNNSFSAVPKQFLLFQKLIEWHFDIADLLSKGEAIDVNTFDTNPYK